MTDEIRNYNGKETKKKKNPKKNHTCLPVNNHKETKPESKKRRHKSWKGSKEKNRKKMKKKLAFV